MNIFERLSITNLMKKATNLVIEKPVLDGVWIDLNYTMRGKSIIFN